MLHGEASVMDGLVPDNFEETGVQTYVATCQQDQTRWAGAPEFGCFATKEQVRVLMFNKWECHGAKGEGDTLQPLTFEEASKWIQEYGAPQRGTKIKPKLLVYGQLLNN
eukprot:349512-Rhodomonas_salina.1